MQTPRAIWRGVHHKREDEAAAIATKDSHGDGNQLRQADEDEVKGVGEGVGAEDADGGPRMHEGRLALGDDRLGLVPATWHVARGHGEGW